MRHLLYILIQYHLLYNQKAFGPETAEVEAFCNGAFPNKMRLSLQF